MAMVENIKDFAGRFCIPKLHYVEDCRYEYLEHSVRFIKEFNNAFSVPASDLATLYLLQGRSAGRQGRCEFCNPTISWKN
jgi:hypothetical protein